MEEEVSGVPRTSSHQTTSSSGPRPSKRARPSPTPFDHVLPVAAPVPIDNRAPLDSRAIHVAQSADAQIIECLLHKPELLAYYVRLLSQPLATTRDLLPTRSSSDSTKPSKYLFNPSEVQQTVHQYLTPLKQQEGSRHLYSLNRCSIHLPFDFNVILVFSRASMDLNLASCGSPSVFLHHWYSTKNRMA